jgi:mono/diheme cytochrome c family protein
LFALAKGCSRKLWIILNNLALTRQNVQQIALGTIAIVAFVMVSFLGVYEFQAHRSDPYTRSVLSLQGDSTQGNAIFQMNCAGCHGSFADGLVGPSLRNISSRKSKVGIIHQVISGQTPPMPQFQPSPQEMADLLSYLEAL